MRLEAENIPVFLFDEFTITMDWLLSNAIGGVKVQVPDHELEHARAVLGIMEEEQAEQEQKEETEEEESEDEAEEEEGGDESAEGDEATDEMSESEGGQPPEEGITDKNL